MDQLQIPDGFILCSFCLKGRCNGTSAFPNIIHLKRQPSRSDQSTQQPLPAQPRPLPPTPKPLCKTCAIWRLPSCPACDISEDWSQPCASMDNPDLRHAHIPPCDRKDITVQHDQQPDQKPRPPRQPRQQTNQTQHRQPRQPRQQNKPAPTNQPARLLFCFACGGSLPTTSTSVKFCPFCGQTQPNQ